MPKYDEAALRRDPFSEGYAVELADGQKYVFPAVRMRVAPFEKDDGGIEVRYRPVYACDLEREIDVMFGVVDCTEMEYFEARMRTAAALLRSNYDLPRGAVTELLAHYGDEASKARMRAISAAIVGRDPAAKDEDEEIDGDPKGEPTANG